jgi:hypothetical protein
VCTHQTEIKKEKEKCISHRRILKLMTGARECDLIFGGGMDKLNLMIVIMCPVRQFDDEQITRLEPPQRERERLI